MAGFNFFSDKWIHVKKLGGKYANLARSIYGDEQ